MIIAHHNFISLNKSTIIYYQDDYNKYYYYKIIIIINVNFYRNSKIKQKNKQLFIYFF